MLQWEEIERERKDRDEEYLRMMELGEQDEAESLRIDLGLETTFANVGVSVTNRQNLSQLLVRLGGVPVT